MLQETANILPCDVCRAHFQEAIRTLRLPGPTAPLAPRAAVRHMLWATHASTGGALSEADLTAEYGYGGNLSAVVTEVQRLVGEVVGAFREGHVLDRFRMPHLEPWARAVRQLANLLATPEMVTTQGRRRR